jgi:hypothetical protein
MASRGPHALSVSLTATHLSRKATMLPGISKSNTNRRRNAPDLIASTGREELEESELMQELFTVDH